MEEQNEITAPRTEAQKEQDAMGLLGKYSGLSLVPSPHPAKYFACFCSVTRNELHLKEWLFRNILAGVNHIYLHDNNRVQLGRDFNITRLIQPFVDAGYVTHIPLAQNYTGRMNDGIKHGALRECFQKYIKPNCRYGSTVDTDEMWYPQDLDYILGNSSTNNGGMGQLRRVIEHYEAKVAPNAVGFEIQWDMVWAQGRILKSEKPLMVDFPYSCGLHWLAKHWYNASRAETALDHQPYALPGYSGASVVSREFEATDGAKQPLWLVHYWYKSIEEFVLKKEMSFHEFRRDMNNVDKCLHKRRYPYSEIFVQTIQHLMAETAHLGDAGELLGELGSVTQAFNPSGAPQYAEYMFFKWVVSVRYEWDEQAYLNHPANQNFLNTTLSKYADGLEHYRAEGFLSGKTVPCFITPKRERICLRMPD